MSLEAAVKLALANPIQRLPRMASVIYDKRKLVSVGLNGWRSHPLQARYSRHPDSIHLHAEIAALAAAKRDVEGCTIYVARVLRDGSTAMARPCVGCLAALSAFGIDDIIWTV